MNNDAFPDHLDTTRAAPPLPRGIPAKIGKYILKREIARGGMGVVYEGLQDEPRRAVAIKVMKRGIESEDALRRFRYESQSLARLRHPGIAQVYEAGTHDDGSGAVPFFAMEYIPNARTLTEYAEHKKLDLRQRLRLFAKVCDAVQHGHQRGIIHRDLKPGNILVDASGHPRVIDFGVARSTDSDMATIQTEVGQIIGSLQYMSPEQFDADPHDIDVRSDVYALGIILFELLHGRLPYDVRNTTIAEAARIVHQQEPPRLGKLDATLRGDVETIVLKALEKDRERRYPSASALGTDIQRYLNGEPILARPPSLSYQLQVFARRYRPLMAAIAAILVILAGASVVSTSAWFKANRERARAEEQSEKTLAAVNFLKAMVGSAVPEGFGDDVGLGTVLDQAVEGIPIAFRDDPATQAELHATIALGYGSLWRWADAKRHARIGLEMRRHIYGSRHPATLQSLKDLDHLCRVTGDSEARVKVLEELVDAESSLYGAKHDETLSTRENLALAYLEERQPGLAKDVAQDVCSIREESLGSDAEETLSARMTLATIALEQQHYARVEAMGLELLAAASDTLGSEHIVARQARSLLGAAYLSQGKIEESKALYGYSPSPANLGITSSFQGEPGPYREGANIYVFWEAW